MKKKKEGRPQGRAVYKVGPKSEGTRRVARFALKKICLDGGQENLEQRSEAYGRYAERVAERLPQSSAKAAERLALPVDRPRAKVFQLMGDKRSQSLEDGYVSSDQRNLNPELRAWPQDKAESRIERSGTPGTVTETRRFQHGHVPRTLAESAALPSSRPVWRKVREAVGYYGPVFHALVPGRISLWPSVRATQKIKAAKGPSYGSVFHALVPGRKSVFVWLLTSVFVLTLSLAHLTPVTPAHAAINEQLNFQARLLNASGGLVPDGFYNVQFNIYSGGDGDPSTADESLEWTGTHLNDNTDGVRVVNGYLSVQLGSSVSQVNTLADVDWNDSTLWLSINIGDTGSGSSCGTEANFNTNCGGDGEMDPFMRLTSVPYAFNANRLDNLDSTDFVQLGQGTQTDASTNSSIAINKTGTTGDILTLQDGGTTELLFNQDGDLSLGSASDNGALILSDGSSNTGTIVTAALGSNRVYTFPDADGTVLLDSTLATTAFIQNGNSFGATAVLGTNDAQSLAFETGGVTNITLADGGAVTFQNETDSVSGLRVMDADGGNPVLNVDTTNERVGIGTNAPATNFHVLLNANSNTTIRVENTDANGSALAEFNARNDLGSDASFGIGSSTYGVNAYRDRAFVYGGGAGVSLIAGGASGDIQFFTDGDLATNERLKIENAGNVIINEPGNDIDFRVESDTNANAFFLQGSDGRLGLGTNAPSADLTFGDGADKTIDILARTTNAAGRALTVKAGDAGAGGSAFSGGQLNLQGGNAAGTGNANGGNVSLVGGLGTGTGVKGLVVIDTPTLLTASTQNCTGTPCAITQANVDSYGAVVITTNATGYTVTLGDPTLGASAAGRLIYITNADATDDFTLSANAGGETITLKPNTTATMIWNGSDWTAAGASSSTDLQAAYDNTATSAGGAELVLSAAGGNADGLTIRNNATTPITGGIFEVQTSIGTNLLSVNNLGTELAANGGSENSATWSTDWTTITGATVARTTTNGEYVTGQAGAEVTTSTSANSGIRNNLSGNPVVSTTYTVSFTARLASGTFSTLQVAYSRDGGTDFELCANYSTQTLSTSVWTKITCTITTDGTSPTNPDLVIRQTDAGTARNFWIDNLSFIRNDNTTQPSNVQIGGGITGGQVTLFTLDRASAPPVADGDTTYLGSMYYDTTSGRIQCYEADGWGACGSPPNNIITLTPEYAGSVLNGTGVGTMTADFCADESGILQVNATLCATGEAVNYYAWTSPQATSQTYSIYLTFQLPTTFEQFIDNNTITLDAYTTDTSDASVNYEIFRSTGSAITECGSDTTVTSSNNTWQTVAHNGNEQNGCSFAEGDRVIFKLNMTARNNDTVYVSDINFTYVNE